MTGDDLPNPPPDRELPFRLVASDGGEAAMAVAARRWLERLSSRCPSNALELERGGGLFSALTLRSLRVLRSGGGRVLCTFRVPKLLADSEGRWSPGAIAALMDDVGAAAIATVVGEIKISVEFDICYYSPAMADEQVEIDGRVLYIEEKLVAVTVEIRKKAGGSLVAVGRQWMTSMKGHSKL